MSVVTEQRVIGKRVRVGRGPDGFRVDFCITCWPHTLTCRSVAEALAEPDPQRATPTVTNIYEDQAGVFSCVAWCMGRRIS